MCNIIFYECIKKLVKKPTKILYENLLFVSCGETYISNGFAEIYLLKFNGGVWYFFKKILILIENDKNNMSRQILN